MSENDSISPDSSGRRNSHSGRVGSALLLSDALGAPVPRSPLGADAHVVTLRCTLRPVVASRPAIFVRERAAGVRHPAPATMVSTKETEATCTYIGVDITDRCSDSARPMDVCGLEMRGGKLIPHFWTWRWTPPGLIDVSGLLPEIAAATAVMLDGPQGLARVGRGIRACEKALAAAGKTADVRPSTAQPYGGFIASSLDLFAAFHAAKLFLAPEVPTRLYEVYPAAIWTRLARRLPNKRRSTGRQARGAILKTLGVDLPETALTHDELDACAAALLAAATDARIQGIGVAAVGDPVYWDPDAACLREGKILVPEVDGAVLAKLQSVVRPWVVDSAEPPRRVPSPASLALRGDSDLPVVRRPLLDGATREDRAGQLFELLASELAAGRPTLCTYKAAVKIILEYEKYTPAYGSMLLKLATSTGTFEIDSLGEIRLDTFLVNQKHRPGDGHWDSATYSQSEWDRAFAGAVIIE